MKGHLRIHSRYIPGHPGFSALVVETRDFDSPAWKVIDLYSLRPWLARAEAREDMCLLLADLQEAGYRPLEPLLEVEAT